MSLNEFRSRATSWALVALLSLGPGVAIAGGAATGSVGVTSDPQGAEVYVDGELAGTTPLSLQDVAVGPHRVRVAMDGFLENQRIVRVEAGDSVEVAVPLKEHRADDPRYRTQAAAGSGGGGGGGGGKKALLIGLGAAAAGAGVWLAVRDTNKPPTVGSVSASPSVGLASATSISFTAQGASDPDGDSLSYSWDFGDGSTGSGQSTTHVYADMGNYSATVTVSDGEESVTASGNVTIRDLSGSWNGAIDTTAEFGFPWGTTVTLSQNGSSLSGSYDDIFGFTGPITGSVSPPSGVTFTVNFVDLSPLTFTGEANGAISALEGRATGSGFTGQTWTLAR